MAEDLQVTIEKELNYMEKELEDIEKLFDAPEEDEEDEEVDEGENKEANEDDEYYEDDDNDEYYEEPRKTVEEVIDDYLENALDVELEVSLDGRVNNIKVVLGVGGPYVELDIGNKELNESWGGHYVHRHVYADRVLDYMWSSLEETFQSR